jgi:hypothetical protein
MALISSLILSRSRSGRVTLRDAAGGVSLRGRGALIQPRCDLNYSLFPASHGRALKLL